MICTRCEGFGFMNMHVLPDSILNDDEMGAEDILKWMHDNQLYASIEDCTVCDCCGDGEGWYGVPGEHYSNDDPQGKGGPYEYNGGLCECH